MRHRGWDEELGPRRTRSGRAGDAVHEGDALRTKRLSRLELELRDGSRVRLSELSRLEVTKYLLGEQPDSLLQASRGRLVGADPAHAVRGFECAAAAG